MTLTLGHAPLSGRPPQEVNYALDGPAHKLLLTPFARRLRAFAGDEVVLDTTGAALLHETGIVPQVYVPLGELRGLTPSDTTSFCPFKGDAAYFHAGGARDAVWTYPDAILPWLRPLAGLWFDRFDRWLDEDEEVFGHLRDPFHRVDARRSSRPVTVRAGDVVVADSARPVLVDENGLPPRMYLPREDVSAQLRPSATRTHCPYKGDATYFDLVAGDEVLVDAAWSYEQPYADVAIAAGHVCLRHEALSFSVG